MAWNFTAAQTLCNLPSVHPWILTLCTSSILCSSRLSFCCCFLRSWNSPSRSLRISSFSARARSSSFCSIAWRCSSYNTIPVLFNVTMRYPFCVNLYRLHYTVPTFPSNKTFPKLFSWFSRIFSKILTVKCNAKYTIYFCSNQCHFD